MTQDDIIRMALQSGFERNSLGWSFTYGRLDDHLERFAALVEHAVLTRQKARYYQDGYEAGVAAEREACAKLVENYGPARVLSGEDCAAAIRTRG
jgi:hypothetical protein